MQPFSFHPVIAHWFEQKFGTPTEPQVRGWPAIQTGKPTLIAAPTGSGKTLTAFLAALDQLFRQGLAGTLRDETSVLYISPLKALSNDIHKNLEEPLREISAAFHRQADHPEARQLQIRADVRTGDTPATKRQAMARKPPHILVTTPESFYLLLTSRSGRRVLQTVRTVIVDEIHALVDNRRGSHLALSLERLEALVAGPLQRIGLSATQKPLELVANFLVGAVPTANAARPSEPASATPFIVDCGYSRVLDLALELPGSPLEAVMSNEVWSEVYHRLAELVEAHRTTLIFVNTRRLAERVTQHLAERLGRDKVTSHHGSLSARLRLEAEDRLKRGELRALVATASLELGIDIGSVELVCQVGPTRSIARLLQRVGRARHQRGGVPKGRVFPLSRDELVECAAMVRSVRRDELDELRMPEKPLDVLAQQIVACAATDDWDEAELFEMARRAWPYRALTRTEFDETIHMLAEGFSTKRGRRAALLHHDGINHRVRARRGAGLLALTSGGAIPDTGDYRVVLEPSETFIGTVNEDFAVESLAGDIFQLGNASWKILGINAGTVRVEDAHGQPPNIPFWLGEAPGRTAELSQAVSDLRRQIECCLRDALPVNSQQPEQDLGAVAQPASDALKQWLQKEIGPALPDAGARQLATYFRDTYRALGVVPSQDTLVLERFFDESGGMQLVIHSPFGIRINRAWGLALRKRFCRSFNFELQAAATDEAIVLSLGTQHSFPLDDVFRYLHSRSVRGLLVQALLDAPMFPIRWRWNATRALALPRQRGGRKLPPALQRMESENLLASVFPDQLACPENLVGDRQVPDHPLVRQTIDDCLTEAMDIDGLEAVLRRIEAGTVQCVARDLPEPSPIAHEILHARPYAFLDNAPLEERRTQAVYTRRAGEPGGDSALGVLDPAAIERVTAEAWPRAANPDELHDALFQAGLLSETELARVSEHWRDWLQALETENRVLRVLLTGPEPAVSSGSTAVAATHREPSWAAAERGGLLAAIYPRIMIQGQAPALKLGGTGDPAEAVRELVRGRIEISGPVTAQALRAALRLGSSEINQALLALEAEGFVLRGAFTVANRAGARGISSELEWCDRRLLARIHRLTINRLRAEIQPVSVAEFQRFLTVWQRVEPEERAEGPEGLAAVLELLDGYETQAGAWEPDVLASRVKDYSPDWLDRLCLTGRVGWGRLRPGQNGRPSAPVRSSPVALFLREHLPAWLALARPPSETQFVPDTLQVLNTLAQGGAMFFDELARRGGLLPSRCEQGLAELVAQGWVTADSFEGLRALLLPADKRLPFIETGRKSRHNAVSGVERAGRWSLLREAAQPSIPEPAQPNGNGPHPSLDEIHAREKTIELLARTLLRRYGVVFRKLLERETFDVTWYELGRSLRRLEARGEIRGGYFISGISGEQFALPEAVGLLRSVRKRPATRELIVISGADPLNLAGIVTPGPRVGAVRANRLLLRDGVPVAFLEAGHIIHLQPQDSEPALTVERALRVGTLPAPLRPYYA